MYDIEIQALSTYSPDFMLVEPFWQWLWEDVTHHTCHNTKADLKAQVASFQQRVNATPLVIAEQLWVKSYLDPKEEELRFST